MTQPSNISARRLALDDQGEQGDDPGPYSEHVEQQRRHPEQPAAFHHHDERRVQQHRAEKEDSYQTLAPLLVTHGLGNLKAAVDARTAPAVAVFNPAPASA